MSDNLFEKAARMRIRFDTKRGVITAEDLWDFGLSDLNALFQGLRKQQRNSEDESLLDTQTHADQVLSLKVELVKYVFETKKLERDAAEARAAQKEEKNRLLEVLARKQQAGLEALDEAELLKRIAALE